MQVRLGRIPKFVGFRLGQRPTCGRHRRLCRDPSAALRFADRAVALARHCYEKFDGLGYPATTGTGGPFEADIPLADENELAAMADAVCGADGGGWLR